MSSVAMKLEELFAHCDGVVLEFKSGNFRLSHEQIMAVLGALNAAPDAGGPSGREVPSAAPVAALVTEERAPRGMPRSNNGEEQHDFEAWAKAQGYDMAEHPLHWLFLNERTYHAREGWRAALEYVARVVDASAVSPPRTSCGAAKDSDAT